MALHKSIGDAIARLRGMSWDEFRTRCQQEINKCSDRAAYALGLDPALREMHPRPAKKSGPGARPPREGRFFFESGDIPLVVDEIKSRLPGQAKEIVERAARVCQHRFDLLGFEGVDYGPCIDWHLDAVHGRRAPLKPWYKIRFLEFSEVGDHKIIWELNRHQHLVTLAKAWCLSGEVRFGEELFKQWYGWHQANPYPFGINWASSLEVAFRSLSWLWVRALVKGQTKVPALFERNILKALALSGRHIERYLSVYSSPNTHLLGEAVALFFIGTLCPSLKSSDRWQRLGWDIVVREARRQVRPDGWYFEQSSHYHVYALDFFLHFRTLAAQNGLRVLQEFDKNLFKMLQILSALAQAGAVPAFGDDDGGRVFDPARNQAIHLADPLATGAVIFNNEQFKAAARGLREETLWLLGREGASKFDEIPDAPACPQYYQFPESGIYILAEQNPVLQQMTMDAGPLGTGNGGHGHADALSVHLSVAGREWLVDPGAYCYVCPDGGREQFRATRAHNTLEVDDLSQADPAGPFAWRRHPRVRTEAWVTGKGFELFKGSHNGYRRLAQPVLHRRIALHVKQAFWLVQDFAEGAGEHQLTLRWHLASWLRAIYGDPGFRIVPRFVDPAQPQPLELWCLPSRGHGWEQGIEAGYCSPAYGRKQAAHVVYFSKRASLPQEFAVLWVPSAGNGKPGRFERLEPDEIQAGLAAYRYNDNEAIYHLFFRGQEANWVVGPWSSDAQFLMLAAQPNSRAIQLAWAGGSYFEFRSKRWVTLQSSASLFELHLDAHGTRIHCDPADALPEKAIRIPVRLREAFWKAL
jgi:hypothetical protein